jgi:hypothetical protein
MLSVKILSHSNQLYNTKVLNNRNNDCEASSCYQMLMYMFSYRCNQPGIYGSSCCKEFKTVSQSVFLGCVRPLKFKLLSVLFADDFI